MAKVKVKIECPHCQALKTVETSKYHKVLYESYFKNRVIEYNELKEKTRTGEFQFELISMVNQWLDYYECDSCKKNFKFHNAAFGHSYREHNKSYNDVNNFNFIKAGKRIDPKLVDKFFGYLETKSRSGAANNGSSEYYIPCEKEKFVTKVAKLFFKKYKGEVFIMKTDESKFIGYVGNISYVLGHGEDIRLIGYDLLLNTFELKLNQHSMKSLEYDFVDKELAKQIVGVATQF